MYLNVFTVTEIIFSEISAKSDILQKIHAIKFYIFPCEICWALTVCHDYVISVCDM